MKFQYLGTAASEGIPAMFCHCEVCKTARKNGGKDIRGRSGGVVNDKVMIDFPPDAYFHSLRFNIDLGGLEGLFFTHSHSDHCDMIQLEYRKLGGLCTLEENQPPLKVYGNKKVREMFEHEGYHHDTASFEFIEVVPYQKYEVAGITVTPLPAAHNPDELCLIYLIEDNGKRMIYGNDTTYFHEEVLDFLSGTHLDIVSLDCTSGLGEEHTRHMGLKDCVKLKNDLISRKSADDNTIFIITHFSHGGESVLHEQLEKGAKAVNFEVAYDGRVVCL